MEVKRTCLQPAIRYSLREFILGLVPPSERAQTKVIRRLRYCSTNFYILCRALSDRWALKMLVTWAREMESTSSTKLQETVHQLVPENSVLLKMRYFQHTQRGNLETLLMSI